jgi:hypothetical protein
MSGLPSARVDAERVWRYMKFSRFVWMLQKKQLWLSRADLLGDPWEITLAGEQLAHMISHAPTLPLPRPEVMPETAMQRAERIIPMWRRNTFINCWSASDHESHALWRIYCGSAEGVVIQTTFARLQASVGSMYLLRVTYETPGRRRQTPEWLDLATKKRPMFAYEQEVRVIDCKEGEHSEQEILGYGLQWEPEKNVQSIRVHPEADDSFIETVVAVVEQYAPALKDRVAKSEMSTPPPF